MPSPLLLALLPRLLALALRNCRFGCSRGSGARGMRDALVMVPFEAPGAPIPTAQSFISISTQSITAAALVAARRQHGCQRRARCHLNQLEEYEIPAHFDTRRRHALVGRSPLRTVICAHDLEKAAASAALVAARSNLPLPSVRSKVPAVCVAKDVPVAIPAPSSPTVRYAAQDAPVTAPAQLSPTRVLGASRLTNVRQSARAKQPATKASKGSSRPTPAKRMFIGEKEMVDRSQFHLAPNLHNYQSQFGPRSSSSLRSPVGARIFQSPYL
ncbi:hypothetical protein B0H13DRAFT_2270280 [Mycena leptocephala]|nr:hypothetical protein B0H13DRAFT_2270280 [Mycena leptocephala]